MGIGDTAESALLGLVFCATAWARWADDASINAETNISVVLHTADPGDDGAQDTNETSYLPYARTSVARSPAGWRLLSAVSPDISGVISPVNNIDFPVVVAGSPVQSLTHFSVAGASGGAGAPIPVERRHLAHPGNHARWPQAPTWIGERHHVGLIAWRGMPWPARGQGIRAGKIVLHSDSRTWSRVDGFTADARRFPRLPVLLMTPPTS